MIKGNCFKAFLYKGLNVKAFLSKYKKFLSVKSNSTLFTTLFVDA